MSTLYRIARQSAIAILVVCALVFGLAASVVSEARGLMATAPTLGSAASFLVLGGSTVTNTGSSTVNGNLGVSPGSAVTGFPPGAVTGGTIHKTDAVAGTAQTAVTTAYNSLAGQPCTADLTGKDLGGMTLKPGVYCFSSSAQLTGDLTLDASGDGNAVFVFKTGSTLTTASNSRVLVINAASPCNVFWQIGSSATLGTKTSFTGSILALTSISLNNGANVQGRALARNGAVTMINNIITPALCSAAAPTSAPAAPASAPAATAAPTATATATSVPTTVPTTTATAVPAAVASAKAVASTAKAVTTLPKSGDVPPSLLLSIGAVLASLGWVMRRSG